MLNTKLYLNKELFLKDVERISMRTAFGNAITEIGDRNEDIVCLTANLIESTKLTQFANKFPKRCIDVGIAEQNMAGIAAGMALSGKIPFITSYAVFNPGRNWEQIRVSIALNNANVKIIGSHAGLSHSADGATAQGLEDIALMRVLPNLTVISPCDAHETAKAVDWAAKHEGPVYIRLSRHEAPVLTTPNTPFYIDKSHVFVQGDDITLLATGSMVYEALLAAKELKAKYKVGAEVINCAVIKPLDTETIIKSAKKTKRIFTIEDHQISGGFGSAVTEILSTELPTYVHRLGINDTFGKSGSYDDLKDFYGISSHRIVEKVMEVLSAREK